MVTTTVLLSIYINFKNCRSNWVAIIKWSYGLQCLLDWTVRARKSLPEYHDSRLNLHLYVSSDSLLMSSPIFDHPALISPMTKYINPSPPPSATAHHHHHHHHHHIGGTCWKAYKLGLSISRCSERPEETGWRSKGTSRLMIGRYDLFMLPFPLLSSRLPTKVRLTWWKANTVTNELMSDSTILTWIDQVVDSCVFILGVRKWDGS